MATKVIIAGAGLGGLAAAASIQQSANSVKVLHVLARAGGDRVGRAGDLYHILDAVRSAHRAAVLT